MFNETLVLRGGYTDLFLEDSEKGLTLGAGFQAKIQGSIGFSVNYAYQDFEHLGGVDRISVLLSF